MRSAESKLVARADLPDLRQRLRQEGRTLVLTTGCFDLMHAGHASYLQYARNLGDALLVALNTDASVRRLKGDKRPVVDQQNRARMMAALECVDYVTFFDEDEPRDLVAEVLPDILVKAA
ncbi:MAG: adenylyltransferase/cytidyltransferase family protein, partial [Kiritimatiellae bacterium]|nr:adenylyltransferase/cytidyltransferase family protein [Kiritimatiellia bacterium]